MNVQEFAVIASAIKAAYPNSNPMPDKQSKDVWYTMLKDIDYPTGMAATKELISTCKFAPAIAEIRTKAAELTRALIKDWGDSWGQVQKTIRQFGMYREAEALDSLDDRVKRCVQRLGYNNLCVSKNIAVERANFRNMYEQMVEREKEEAVLPPALKEIKQQLRQLAQQPGHENRLEGSR